MIEIILHDICDTFPYLKYGYLYICLIIPAISSATSMTDR